MSATLNEETAPENAEVEKTSAQAAEPESYPDCEAAPAVQKAPSCAFVIFGGTGDLAHRKLLPALAALHLEGQLSDDMFIVTYARRAKDEASYREEVREALKEFGRDDVKSSDKLDGFLSRIYYHQGEYDRTRDFRALETHLQQLEEDHKTEGRRVFYTATPPEVFDDIIDGLRASELAKLENEETWRRIVIEKPFGTDLKSAKVLNRTLHSVFQEDQVFRIDHYLGKETVQNILVMRFANSFFEPLWNYKYVDHVQITVAETVGVEARAGYFDQAGLIRDMIQSHSLQVLTLIGMESPVALDANAIRDEKVKVLRSLRPPDRADLILGQYVKGKMGGKSVPGYLEEDGVPKDSHTETYAALRLHIDNLRWAGVPFYIRSGKRMPQRMTEVAIRFRDMPEILYSRLHCSEGAPNTLVLRIQPDEGMELHLGAKMPGAQMRVAPVNLKFLYAEEFGTVGHDAYERLLLDTMRGDAALFARADEVEAAWQYVEPILQYRNDGEKPHPYPAGADGPAAADLLLAASGREWRPI